MRAKRAWFLCAAWMIFIFVMSATPGDVSGEESGAIVEILVRIVEAVSGGILPDAVRANLEFFVRKAAHMTEYFVLFLLSRRALSLSGARRPGAAALLLCAAYAATDEFHQRFVEDRGASPVDVAIDTAGAALAWAVYACYAALSRRRRARADRQAPIKGKTGSA